jgi:hypothetical protein
VLGSQNVQAALLAIPMELQRITSELQAGMAEFHNGTRLTAARYVDVGRRLAWGGAGRLVGWSVRAEGGAVTLTLRNGRDDSGEIMAVVQLDAANPATVWLGPGGVAFGEALYLDVTGPGQLVGAVWIGAVD